MVLLSTLILYGTVPWYSTVKTIEKYEILWSLRKSGALCPTVFYVSDESVGCTEGFLSKKELDHGFSGKNFTYSTIQFTIHNSHNLVIAAFTAIYQSSSRCLGSGVHT